MPAGWEISSLCILKAVIDQVMSDVPLCEQLNHV
jgi:hypothetical protein